MLKDILNLRSARNTITPMNPLSRSKTRFRREKLANHIAPDAPFRSAARVLALKFIAASSLRSS